MMRRRVRVQPNTAKFVMAMKWRSPDKEQACWDEATEFGGCSYLRPDPSLVELREIPRRVASSMRPHDARPPSSFILFVFFGPSVGYEGNIFTPSSF